MTSDENALAAYDRDEGWCQWCLHKLETFNTGSTPHHVFGRHYDLPEHQITLCMVRRDGSLGCHQRIHQTGEITRDNIVALCMGTIWEGEDLTPNGR